MPTAAGYSGTPLCKNLSLEPGLRVWFEAMPSSVLAEIDMPDLTYLSAPQPGFDAARMFVTQRSDMEAKLSMPRPLLRPADFISVSWPKKASKAPTLTRC